MKKKIMAALTAAALLLPLVPAVSYAGGSVIGHVSVDGFVKPVIGETGVPVSELSVPDGSSYLIESANWYVNDGGEPLTGDWVFEEGNAYKLVIILGTESSDDEFTEDKLDGLLNGSKEYIGWCSKLAGDSEQAALQTVNFSMEQSDTARLSGYVWRDMNKNGKRPYYKSGDEPSEEPENETSVSGVVISIYNDYGEKIADCETGEDGSYSIDVPYGLITVVAAMPGKYSEYEFTVPEKGVTTIDLSTPKAALDIGIAPKDEQSTGATAAPDSSGTKYDIWICGEQVTDANKTDVFGNGAFVYDSAEKKLTVKGDASDQGMILKAGADLKTIDVAGDSKIFSAYTDAIVLGADVTITGEGILTLGGHDGWQDSVYSGIQTLGDLTIDHANVVVSGKNVISGSENSKLKITASKLTSDCTKDPIIGFGKGIVLEECAVASPEGAYIKDGAVYDKNDDKIAEFVIEPTKSEAAVSKDPRWTDWTHPFNDVPENSYFEQGVIWAYNNNVTTGTTETTFSPNDTCTRGQVVTFLWRAAGSPEPENTYNPFSDVSKSDYFYKAVLWAVGKGITAGTTATTFSPELTCSSAHIITFLYRAMGIGSDGWYEEAKDWSKGEGLLASTGLSVSPDEPCPRGAVVTFLERVYNK